MKQVAGCDYLFIANAGDCRAVLYTEKGEVLHFDHMSSVITDFASGGRLEAVQLSRDMTGRDPEEIRRLQSEHPDEPDVVSRGRVKGYLGAEWRGHMY